MPIRYGISSEVGLRETMEDEYAIYDLPEKGFFSAEVYDGHGGRRAAILASEMLTPYFLNRLEKAQNEGGLEGLEKKAILLRDAYLAADRYLIEHGIDSGTTAATFYIIGGGFICANAGDTRVVAGIRGGAKTLSLDHKPDLPEERARIEGLGGRVSFYDVARVEGILAVSRALGDRYLKPYVSAEPYITKGLLGKENDYVVIACDGVWDVLLPSEVIKIAREAVEPQKGAEAIARTAISSGSTDNITVIVLELKRYVKGFGGDYMEIY